MANQLDYLIKIGTDTGQTSQKLDMLGNSLAELRAALNELIETNKIYQQSVQEVDSALKQAADTFIFTFFIELGYQIDKNAARLANLDANLVVAVKGLDVIGESLRGVTNAFANALDVFNPFSNNINQSVSAVKELATATHSLKAVLGDSLDSILDPSKNIVEKFASINQAVFNAANAFEVYKKVAAGSIAELAVAQAVSQKDLQAVLEATNNMFQRAGNAAAVYDEALKSVGINVGAVAAEIQTNLDSATKSLEADFGKLDETLKGFGINVGDVTAQVKTNLDSVSQAVQNPTASAEALGNAFTKNLDLVKSHLDRLGKDASPVFDTLNQNFNTSKEALQEFGNNFVAVNQKAFEQLGLTERQAQQLELIFNSLSGNSLETFKAVASNVETTNKVLNIVSDNLSEIDGDLAKVAGGVLHLSANLSQLSQEELRKFGEAIDANARSFSNLIGALDVKITPGLLSDLVLSMTELNSWFDAINSGVTQTAKTLQEFAGITIPVLSNFRQEAFKAFAEFDTARAKVGTLAQDSTEFANRIREVAKELGYQYTAAELLNNAYDVLSAGFTDTASAIEVVKNAAILSKAGFTDNKTAVDALTSVLNAYSISARESKAVVDQLIQTQNLGKLTIAEYGTSIGNVVTIAAQAGISLQELNAFIATATLKGVSASEAITGLNQAISSVLNPSEQAKALASQLGIAFDSTALKTKGLAGILAELNAKGLDTPEVLNKLFSSVEAVNAIIPATGEGIKAFEANLRSLSSTAGVADKAFQSVTDTAMSRAQAFANRVNDSLLGIGQVVQHLIERTTAFGNVFLSVFEKLDPRTQIGVLTIAFEGVANTIGRVISTITTVTLTLAATYAAWQLATNAARGFAEAVETGAVVLEVLNKNSIIYRAALQAWNMASGFQQQALGFLIGQQKELAFTLDLNAIKTTALAAANKTLELGIGIVNSAILAQTTFLARGVGWALDGFNAIMKYADAHIVAAKSINIAAGTQGLLNKAIEYLRNIGVFDIIREGLAFSAQEVKKFAVNIASLAYNITDLIAIQINNIAQLDIGTKAQALWNAAVAFGSDLIATFKAKIAALNGVYATYIATTGTATTATGGFAAVWGLLTAAVGPALKAIGLFLGKLALAAAQIGIAVLAFETLRFAITKPFDKNESLDSINKAIKSLEVSIDGVNKKATESAKTGLAAYFAGYGKLFENVDKSNNLIEKTAQIMLNLYSAMTGQAHTIDEFGQTISVLGLKFEAATFAQKELADSTIALSDFILQTSKTYTEANNVLIQYRHSQNLTAEQIEVLKGKAQSYIEKLKAEIAAYKEIKPASEGQRKDIEFEIAVREKLIGKLTSVIENRKVEIKSLDEIKNAYSEQTKAIDLAVTTQTAKILESQLARTTSEKQAQEQIAAIELEGIQKRIAAASAHIQKLRDALIPLDPVKDAETVKNIQQEIATVEEDQQKNRVELAKRQLALRQQAEEEALRQIVDANKRAQEAVNASVQGQIIEVKKLGLAREQEAKRIADIEAAATNQRVQLIQQEIAQVAQALNQGTIDREAANARLLELNNQLAAENQKRIEATIAQEKALIDTIVALGEQKVKAAVDQEKEVQAQVAELLNQGAITKEQADQRLLQSTLQRYQAEYDAARENLDRLLALPSPTDPVAERERIAAIQAARTQLTDATINLQKQIAENDKAILEQRLAGYDREKTVIEAQTESLKRQQELRAAQIGLATAITDAAISRSEIEISRLQEALEIRRKLDQESNLSHEQRILLQQRLNELGIAGGMSEKDIRQQILNEQNKLFALKRQQFEAQQASDRAELESRLQLQQLELQSLKIEADKAVARAQARDATEAEKLAAQQLIASYQEQVANFDKLAKTARETLEIKQKTALEAFNAQEQAARFKANLEAAEQSATKVNEGLVTIKTNQQIAAEQTERQARAMAEVAAQAERLSQISDTITHAFQRATSELESMRQGFVALTANNPYTGQVEQALSINIKVAETLQLRKEEISLLQQQQKIQSEIIKLAQEGDRLALEAALIERQEIEKKLANLQAEIQYNNQLIELKKQQDAISQAINASGGMSLIQNEKMRILAQQLVDLSRERQKQLTQEAFAIQYNAQQQFTAVQQVRGQVQQLLMQYQQIPDRVGESAVQANNLSSNIAGAVANTRQLASSFNEVTSAINSAATAASRIGTERVGRATGGQVLPVAYTVNERGQESFLDFVTGQISLLPPGKRTIEFDHPGYVFTAAETKKLFSRADGGYVLGKNSSRSEGSLVIDARMQDELKALAANTAELRRLGRLYRASPFEPPGISILTLDNRNVLEIIERAFERANNVPEEGTIRSALRTFNDLHPLLETRDGFVRFAGSVLDAVYNGIRFLNDRLIAADRKKQEESHVHGSLLGGARRSVTSSSGLSNRLEETVSDSWGEIENATRSGASSLLPRNKKLPGFADGGVFSISPANSFIAGERGPEIITLDGRGGARIFNASETREMLRGFTPKLPTFQSGGTFQARSGTENGIGSVVQKLDELIRTNQETTRRIEGLSQKLDRPNVSINSVEPPGEIVANVYAEIARRNLNSNA